MRAERWLALALVAAGAGCQRREAEPASPARAVHCAPVEMATVEDAIELRGTVAPLPDRDAQVAPQVAGRIVQLMVREGDRVTAGQPVARIDDGPLIDQEKEAAAGLAKVVAERRNAEATLARTERVFEHGIAARQEVDDATTRADSARAAERQAEGIAQRARRQVERATVRSPLAGVVVRLLRRPGELVDGTPATPVVEVADPSHLELDCDAAAAELVRIEKGARAELTVPAIPGAAWAGKVAAVSPAVDRATGLGTVRIAFAFDGAARPPLGVLGAARIVTGPARRAPVIPQRALRSGLGAETDVVLCGGDGLAHVRQVRRGVAAGAKIEVQGLAVGERVALDPLGLTDGQPIDVLP